MTTVITRVRRAALLAPLAALLCAAALSLGGCQTSQASSSSSSGDMRSADLDFVTAAFNIIAFDRDECGLAQTQARSPEVKAMAAKLLTDANAFDTQIQAVAASSGIKPPTVLPSTLRIRAGRLRLGQGIDFDRAFVADQIASHQDALNLGESMVNTPGSNAQLAELSRRGDALVRTNLAALEALQSRLPRRS